MEEDDDNGDSLFEGMVLLTPPHQQQQQQQQSEPEKTEPTEPDHPPPPSQSLSEPLDENLFSDLTLITAAAPQPSSSTDPTSTSTSTSSSSSSSSVLSRQFSATRKKKRAAALRIGYARQSSSSIHNLPPNTHSSTHIVAADEHHEEDSCSRNSLSSAKVEPQPQHLATIQHQEQPPELTSQPDHHLGIDQRFEQIKKLISHKLNTAHEAVASISASRKDSIRRRRNASDTLTQASAKYTDLEMQLEQACEAEDFDEADTLSHTLSEAEKHRQLLLSSLRQAEADCDHLDSKMQELLQAQIQAQEQCASLLSTFSMDAADNSDMILKDAEAMFSKEMEEWLSSTEAVQLNKIELEIQSLLMDESRMVLNDSIEHSVEDDRRERDLLYKKKETLAEELEKLLALVKEKEAEIAENNTNIDKVNKRIAGVVCVFQEEQSNINAKYNNLQSGLSEIEMENESLSKRKEEIDALLSQEEARGAKIFELSRISADEANVYLKEVGLRRSLLQFILRYKEDKESLAKSEEKLSEDVQRLKQEISTARASLQELSSAKSGIQQETDSCRQRLIFLEKRAPELEAEKKVAATARNFKEAARLASEAKTLSIEKETLHTTIEEMLLEARRLEKEISSTLDTVQETEGQMLSKEKELAMARFQRLTLIAGAAAAERSAALELGDVEEAEILLVEAESASAEARRLQPDHDIKEEEIVNLPKYFVSMELVSKFGGKQLEELASSAHLLKS